MFEIFFMIFAVICLPLVPVAFLFTNADKNSKDLLKDYRSLDVNSYLEAHKE